MGLTMGEGGAKKLEVAGLGGYATRPIPPAARLEGFHKTVRNDHGPLSDTLNVRLSHPSPILG
jgi:hypothetical protein